MRFVSLLLMVATLSGCALVYKIAPDLKANSLDLTVASLEADIQSIVASQNEFLVQRGWGIRIGSPMFSRKDETTVQVGYAIVVSNSYEVIGDARCEYSVRAIGDELYKPWGKYWRTSQEVDLDWEKAIDKDYVPLGSAWRLELSLNVCPKNEKNRS